MSIIKAGHLNDSVFVGLIGFTVGIAINAIPLFSAITVLVPAGKVAEAILLGLVSGLFGYLSGGFVAGYTNYRLNKTEGGPKEGLMAGVMALIVHFLITLFVFGAFAMVSPANTVWVVMAGWGVTLVFALIFYPLGGYVAGVLERQTSSTNASTAFQGIPSAPPPP
jgi:hypothetical protein